MSPTTSCSLSPDGRPVVVHVVHSLDRGGTERTLVALLRAFDPSRLRHVVVTLRTAGSLSARLPDHVACRPINAWGRSASWRTGPKLAEVARVWGAGLIHARNTGCWHDATVAALLTPGARLALGFHGLDRAGHFSRRQRWLAQCALQVGARFTSVSEAGRRKLQREGKVPADRIDLLRNGVDLSICASKDAATRRRGRASFNFDDTKFVVGTVGSLTPVKQHSTLITAVARVAESLPNARLLIVGDGPLRDALARQADNEGIGDRVRFTGWREDVPSLLGCMDTYVCSSASEGMNNALLEALAVGLPIVAADVGDNAIMVRDGAEGCIVEPGSSAAIAEALNTLARTPSVRQRFSAAAKARAADYRFDQIVCAYEAYYGELLAGRADVCDRPAASIAQVPA